MRHVSGVVAESNTGLFGLSESAGVVVLVILLTAGIGLLGSLIWFVCWSREDSPERVAAYKDGQTSSSSLNPSSSSSSSSSSVYIDPEIESSLTGTRLVSKLRAKMSASEEAVAAGSV